MRNNKKGPNIAAHRLWVGFFVFWFVMLTGIFSQWTGTPGIKQWFEIHTHLSEKKQEIERVEAESTSLKNSEYQLENNPVAQEREIRKVLGFVDQNEIVFEFEK